LHIREVVGKCSYSGLPSASRTSKCRFIVDLTSVETSFSITPVPYLREGTRAPADEAR